MSLVLLLLLGVGFIAGIVGLGQGEEVADPDLEPDVPDPVIITGTAGDDLINGGPEDELILAGAGDDTVNAGAGNDRIFTYEGRDIVNPGAGDDEVFTGDARDAIDGGFLATLTGDLRGTLDNLPTILGSAEGYTLSQSDYNAIQSMTLVDVQDDLGDDWLRGEDNSDIIADVLGLVDV